MVGGGGDEDGGGRGGRGCGRSGEGGAARAKELQQTGPRTVVLVCGWALTPRNKKGLCTVAEYAVVLLVEMLRLTK